MKYGVLWRKTTKNIGDDIQSYAESVWLPSVDYMVDIEELDSFEAEDDEPVATIMSAWYMWQKCNWPPSKYVYPLWIGFHYNDIQRGRPRGMPSKFEYLTGPGYEYLKQYEPIGCRDYYTQERMEERGIANYFSGCVTLTLPKREIRKPEREYIVLVDVGKKLERAVRKQLEGTDIDVKVIAPTREEPSTNLTWEVRKKQVEEMLDIYQNAKCVLAFRLHCALPCLALETPVLLVRPSFRSVRFTPYKDWMHTAFPDQVINGEFRDFMLNPPANPEDYKPVRAQLEKTISDFISQAKQETRKASELVRTQFTEQELMEWQNKTMKQTLHSYHIECHIDLRQILQQKKQIKDLENQLQRYRKFGEPKDVENAMHDLQLYKRLINYKFFKKCVGAASKVKHGFHKEQ
ncbi:MAG: polysaccharide pyruvyl transferase family protein [Lachnospiraceae bacterium]|nr:polysaccharide pyruvyl transferase family protein [Lachnospiraceae bacterium]